VNDLLFRNRAGETYNIDEYIPKIKAKTLNLHVKNDQWLCCSKAEESCKKIPGAKIATFQNPLAHYAVFRGPNVMKDDVAGFFKGMQ
jgi:homoserine O-acetyltransferase/O-succinyltransferase